MEVGLLDVVTPLRNDALKVIAKGVWALTNLLVDPPNHRLLQGFTLHRLVKLDQPGLSMVVND